LASIKRGLRVSVGINEVRAIVDNLAKKGVAYAVGLYPYIYSLDYEYGNVRRTLEPAFGASVAERVWSEIAEALKGVDKYAKVRVEGREEYLRDYLQRHILKEEVSSLIVDEIKRRLSQVPEVDKRILSVACAIVDKSYPEGYPAFSVHSRPEGFLEVSSSDGEYFSRVTSSLLDVEGLDVRALFCKYLLGFESDWSSRRHSYFELKIYPFAVSFVKALATEASNYIKVPTKHGIKPNLRDLYVKGDLLKLSIVDHALSTTEGSWFLESFFGRPYDVLRDEAAIDGIIGKGFVNPLIYEHVKEAVRSLHLEALDGLAASFTKPFERIGYVVSRVENLYTLTKALARPIHMWLFPWPRAAYIPSMGALEAIGVVVVQGLPSQSILQWLQQNHGGALWLFVWGRKAVVASNTYRDKDHRELLNFLKRSFSIEFLGPAPERPELSKPTEAALLELPTHVIKYINIARDPLEGVVAGTLEALGFSVKVDHKVTGKAGEVEVDVWGEKVVGGARFVAYASCKNWDNPVDVGIVREELGRVLQMLLMPHVRILVAPRFTEAAEREAVADGFVVMEVEERASKESAERVYRRVYDKLNGLFAGVAPKWMQNLAERVKKVADEIRRIGDELERAGRP
jgi:hypothetical protein